MKIPFVSFPLNYCHLTQPHSMREKHKSLNNYFASRSKLQKRYLSKSSCWDLTDQQNMNIWQERPKCQLLIYEISIRLSWNQHSDQYLHEVGIPDIPDSLCRRNIHTSSTHLWQKRNERWQNAKNWVNVSLVCKQNWFTLGARSKEPSLVSRISINN